MLNVNQDDGNGIVSQDVLYIRLAAREYQSMVKNNRGISRLVIVASTVGFGLINNAHAAVDDLEEQIHVVQCSTT